MERNSKLKEFPDHERGGQGDLQGPFQWFYNEICIVLENMEEIKYV